MITSNVRLIEESLSRSACAYVDVIDAELFGHPFGVTEAREAQVHRQYICVREPARVDDGFLTRAAARDENFGCARAVRAGKRSHRELPAQVFMDAERLATGDQACPAGVRVLLVLLLDQLGDFVIDIGEAWNGFAIPPFFRGLDQLLCQHATHRFRPRLVQQRMCAAGNSLERKVARDNDGKEGRDGAPGRERIGKFFSESLRLLHLPWRYRENIFVDEALLCQRGAQPQAR